MLASVHCRDILRALNLRARRAASALYSRNASWPRQKMMSRVCQARCLCSIGTVRKRHMTERAWPLHCQVQFLAS